MRWVASQSASPRDALSYHFWSGGNGYGS